MTCGIYCITNNINGMQYVGQSVNIEERFHQHIHSKSNSEIHQAIAEYGVHNFKFEPLIECSPNELDEQEVKFIRLLGTYENGYNQTRGGQHHVFNVEYDYEQYSKLKEQLKNKNEIIRNLNQKNRRLEGKMKAVHDEITPLRHEIESLKTKNLYLEKVLKQKKNDETIKSLKKRIAFLERGAFTNLKNQNKRLKGENKELAFENEMLRTKIDNSVKEDVQNNNIFLELLSEGAKL